MARSRHILPWVFLLSAWACHTPDNLPRTARPRPPGQNIVEARQIRENGCATAWQALQQMVGLYIVDAPDKPEGVSIRFRGRSSALDTTPLLFIDGMRVTDFRVLRAMPAGDIQRIKVLSSLEADMGVVGSRANGVIEITTVTR